MKTTLAVVVTGDAYVKYAEKLFASAEVFFHPTHAVEYLMLEGTPGWPYATMMRHKHLLENMPGGDFVFLSDADMLFEGEVGDEILPSERGMTATIHPGYVDRHRLEFPYERRSESACCMEPHDGERYYCGGFFGGSTAVMEAHLSMTTRFIDEDGENGLIPVWHDESANNKVFWLYPPTVVLPPSYCYPDNDSWYKTVWKEFYPRKLVALDKNNEVRGAR